MPEELLDTFNTPICAPSMDELREAIEHPPSAFRILQLDTIEKFSIAPDNADVTVCKDAESYSKFMINSFKSGMGPMVEDHVGPERTHMLVERLRQVIETDYLAKKAAGFPMYMSLCVAALVRN